MRTFHSRILAVAAATVLAACGESTSPGAGGDGTVVVRLTDAPFLTDSVKSVNVHVVRVEARVADTDSAAADSDVDNGQKGGWVELAEPNAVYDLLTLQNGASTTLGQTTLAAGTYSGLRFIIDPAKSTVTLKNGTVLTGNDGIKFPSANRSGIKVILSEPLKVVGGATTTLLIDFDVNESFVMRGNSIEKNGLLFKPVIKAKVIDAATVNANVRLFNATANPLSLLQGTSPLASNLAFGTSSSCSSINAAAPNLAITQGTSTTPLPGFAPSLTAGQSYTVIAYPNATGTVQFATLANTYTPTSGQSGLRVFNATTGATGYDLFVTASGAPLGTPTIANVAAGASTPFISVPAGTSQIRLTSAGVTTVLATIASQGFTAGQNTTIVIAPPAAGSTTPQVFVVPAC